MPDTGASQTIISLDIARIARLNIKDTNITLKNASDVQMSLSGQARDILSYEKHSVETSVLLSPEFSHHALIG